MRVSQILDRHSNHGDHPIQLLADTTVIEARNQSTRPAEIVLREPRPLKLPVSPDAPNPSNKSWREQDLNGWTVMVQGLLLWNEPVVSMSIEIEESHVVQIHQLDVPQVPGMPPAGQEEVPEVVRREISQQVKIPASGGHVLLSLGLSRTVDETGKTSISERLVLIDVQRIELTDEIDRRR